MSENHSTKAERAAVYFRMSKDGQENSIEAARGGAGASPRRPRCQAGGRQDLPQG